MRKKFQSCDTLDTEAGFQEEPSARKKPRSNSRKFFQRKESRHKEKENGISERKKDSPVDEVVIGRFEENNGRIRISGSGFEEEKSGGERIRISGFEEESERISGSSLEGQADASGEVALPNGIYCTSTASCQDLCPETFLGRESDALLSVEREVIMDVKEVEEEEGEVVKEVKSCEEYNLQIVSQV